MGYFTYDGLSFRLLLMANGGWTNDKIDCALAQWKAQGKIQEIGGEGEEEPGGGSKKYKPTKKLFSTAGA